jgi:hypothetical protein
MMTVVFAVVARTKKTTRSAACVPPRTFSPSPFTLVCRVGLIAPVCLLGRMIGGLNEGLRGVYVGIL